MCFFPFLLTVAACCCSRKPKKRELGGTRTKQENQFSQLRLAMRGVHRSRSWENGVGFLSRLVPTERLRSATRKKKNTHSLTESDASSTSPVPSTPLPRFLSFFFSRCSFAAPLLRPAGRRRPNPRQPKAPPTQREGSPTTKGKAKRVSARTQ